MILKGRRAQVATAFLLYLALTDFLPAGRRDAPDCVADIIGDQQRARLIDRKANRPAAGLIVAVKETGHNVLCNAVRLSVLEGHEDNLVAVQGLTVPAAMLTDEG